MITWLHICYVRIDPNNVIPCRSFRLLALSVQRNCIINPGNFLTGGTPAEIRGGRGVVHPAEKEGIEVWCRCNIIHHQRCRCYCRGKVHKQASEGVYGENMIVQKSYLGVSSDLNEWSHSWEMRKRRKTT